MISARGSICVYAIRGGADGNAIYIPYINCAVRAGNCSCIAKRCTCTSGISSACRNAYCGCNSCNSHIYNVAHRHSAQPINRQHTIYRITITRKISISIACSTSNSTSIYYPLIRKSCNCPSHRSRISSRSAVTYRIAATRCNGYCRWDYSIKSYFSDAMVIKVRDI